MKPLLSRLDAVLIDVRFAPTSRHLEWRKNYLQLLLKEKYRHVPQLGSRTFREGKSSIQNLDLGTQADAVAGEFANVNARSKHLNDVSDNPSTEEDFCKKIQFEMKNESSLEAVPRKPENTNPVGENSINITSVDNEKTSWLKSKKRSDMTHPPRICRMKSRLECGRKTDDDRL